MSDLVRRGTDRAGWRLRWATAGAQASSDRGVWRAASSREAGLPPWQDRGQARSRQA